MMDLTEAVECGLGTTAAIVAMLAARLHFHHHWAGALLEGAAVFLATPLTLAPLFIFVDWYFLEPEPPEVLR